MHLICQPVTFLMSSVSPLNKSQCQAKGGSAAQHVCHLVFERAAKWTSPHFSSPWKVEAVIVEGALP